jgi:hypothetical protein
MVSTNKFALLFGALTLLIIAAIISTSLIQPVQYNGLNGDGNSQPMDNNYDPSLSNGTSLTVMNDLLVAPEYGTIGSIAAIFACFAAAFVVYHKKKN